MTLPRPRDFTELIALDGLTEGGLSFQGVADFSRTLQICSKGGTASGDDLLAVATTLAAARRLRTPWPARCCARNP